LERATDGMLMQYHEVFSQVTGGRLGTAEKTS
jgi:hypothetical protein